jgi:hypothetical protein
MTFNILIFFDAIGNIITSKILVHFLAKISFNVLILPTYGMRKDQNVENHKDQLPMAYYLCVPRPVGGYVRVNLVRLG